MIELAGEPRGKGRPRFARMGNAVRTFTPAATRSYEATLRLAAQDVMGDRAPLAGPLAVSITATFPIPKSFSRKRRAAAIDGAERPTKKPDADNLMKTIDSLNQVVWDDDAQVVDATVRKIYGERPALLIEVRAAA